MAVKEFFENPVSSTLLIPLIIRSMESRRPGGLFKDNAAEELVAGLPDDIFRFSMHPCMRIGTTVRVRYFDDLAKTFLRDTELPVIVQLGCGLDTRFSRVDSGKGSHVNIDLPEVIALRQKLLPGGSGREADWAGDILKRDWMDRLEKEYPDHRFLFIAEGVFMYLHENGVRQLLMDMADRFPGARIAFDTTGKLAMRAINEKSAVSELDASLTWAYDDDGRLDRWHPRLRRLERAYYYNRFISRWGLWSFMHFTPMGRTSAMFHFMIEAD